MKRKHRVIILIIICVGIVAYFVTRKSDGKESVITAKVEFGSLDVEVNCSGELKSAKNKEILGPSNLREVRVWEIKINHLIPEGTVVDSGQYVGKLDPSAVTSKLKDVQDELKKIENQLSTAKLDTALDLRSLRDALVNKNYETEEAKITLDESKFESPSAIRQAEIKYERSVRALSQSENNYKLKRKQAIAKIEDININKARKSREIQKIMSILQSLTIKAPASGMVIYAKEWNGRKKKVGSNVSAWNPVVATLPDLSSMISKTYVNEIDISKIKRGQNVRIGVDAFPEKEYTGVVTKVANIGEQLAGGVAKVFEVEIKVNESDEILRPAMTTGNKIFINRYEDVLKIPLEGMFSNDSLQFVFVEDGFSVKKKVVKTGESNDNEIVIVEGLKQGDVIRLTAPDGFEKLDYKNEKIMNELLVAYRAKKNSKENKRAKKPQRKKDKDVQMVRGNIKKVVK